MPNILYRDTFVMMLKFLFAYHNDKKKWLTT